MNVAFVVSWLNQYGGAERVLEAAHQLFPDAPIYTSIFDPHAMPAKYRTWDIRVSSLDRLPHIHRRHQFYLPLYPLAFQSFDFSRYDLVVSLTSAFAHGVITRSPTRHLCYCLTPARFLWLYPEYVEKENLGPRARVMLRMVVALLRRWDRTAALRVDEFIAISSVVQGRIFNFYGRESIIIPPPIDVAAFPIVAEGEQGEYFLVVSRLVPYKRIDIAIQAFNRLGLALVVAGDGRDRPRLERMAGSNIHFLGRVSDDERRRLLAGCRAFIFPGEEDFGIAPLEANASGRPVIAFAGGGALDTVKEGENGLLFREANAVSLAECVRSFDPLAFRPAALRAYAERFDLPVFKARLLKRIEDNQPLALRALSSATSAHGNIPG